MKRFEIGPGLSCDLDVLVNTRLLVQANSGGGKSWLLRRLLEQSHGQIQHLVIDPEGEFASLREKFDYVLASRQGGDTLADPRTAKLLAERLLELGASAILDIYELKAHERKAFVRHFLETLVDAPKNLWHPVLVIVDEAHVYCPENDEAESAGAVKDLATRGRKRGFCAVLATQRISTLAKSAAAECNNKLIGRSSLDVDMKRAAFELGFTARDEMLSLRGLDAGQFYAFGPALAKTVTLVQSGPVQTKHPKAGSKLAGIVPPPTEKIKAMLPSLSDLPAEAEARERTVADLKREVTDLKRQLTQAQKAAPAAEVKERAVLTDVDRVTLHDLSTAIRLALNGYEGKLLSVMQAALDDATAAAEKARADLEKRLETKSVQKVLAKLEGAIERPKVDNPAAVTRRYPVASLPVRPAPAPTVAANNGDLTGPQRKILASLGELQALGLYPADKQQLGFMAGYTSIRSGGFSEPLGALVRDHYVHIPEPGKVALLKAGEDAIGYIEAPSTPEEMQKRVMQNLSGPERKLLEKLIELYPAVVSKEDLGAACGYTNIRSGGFSEPLRRLNTLRLVRTPRPGHVVASAFLFLERD